MATRGSFITSWESQHHRMVAHHCIAEADSAIVGEKIEQQTRCNEVKHFIMWGHGCAFYHIVLIVIYSMRRINFIYFQVSIWTQVWNWVIWAISLPKVDILWGPKLTYSKAQSRYHCLHPSKCHHPHLLLPECQSLIMTMLFGTFHNSRFSFR